MEFGLERLIKASWVVSQELRNLGEPFLSEEHISRVENLPKALSRFARAVKRGNVDTRTIANIYDALDAMIFIYYRLSQVEPLSPNPYYIEVIDLAKQIGYLIDYLEHSPKTF